MHDLLYCIFLGIVEGVTEFLPISSTGHLFILTNKLGPLRSEEFTKTFNIFIQIGAILAVVVYFRRRIMELLVSRWAARRAFTPLEMSASAKAPGGAQVAAVPPTWESTGEEGSATPEERRRVIWLVLIATIPVLVIGYLANTWVEKHLEASRPIALALLIAGVAMLVIEWLPTNVTTRRMESMSLTQAVGIGLAQVLSAVFPGTSRSAATIMGGLVAGLSRPAATEFSFFLAIPAMSAACAYKLYKYLKAHPHIPAEELLLLAAGTLVAFLVAWVVIAAFMGYIRRHNFVPFALYRIALGIVALLWLGKSPAPAPDRGDASTAAAHLSPLTTSPPASSALTSTFE